MIIDPDKIRLTKEEKEIERALLAGEYVRASPEEFARIKGMIDRTAAELARRRKDAVLNIRVNSQDLASIKRKAAKLHVPYQRLISELLHIYAQ